MTGSLGFQLALIKGAGQIFVQVDGSDGVYYVSVKRREAEKLLETGWLEAEGRSAFEVRAFGDPSRPRRTYIKNADGESFEASALQRVETETRKAAADVA